MQTPYLAGQSDYRIQEIVRTLHGNSSLPAPGRAAGVGGKGLHLTDGDLIETHQAIALWQAHMNK